MAAVGVMSLMVQILIFYNATEPSTQSQTLFSPLPSDGQQQMVKLLGTRDQPRGKCEIMRECHSTQLFGYVDVGV